MYHVKGWVLWAATFFTNTDRLLLCKITLMK